MIYQLKQFVSRRVEPVFKHINHIDNPPTIICSNCVGGVIYHNIGAQFSSPTINMYFLAEDFILFVENLESFVASKPVYDEEESMLVGFPVMKLVTGNGTVKLYCVHYNTFQEAYIKWQSRKERIKWDNILVIMSDRDGFNESLFNRFERITYQKLLFSATPYDSKNVVWVKKFEGKEQVGRMTDYSNWFGQRFFEKYFDIYEFVRKNSKGE